MKRLMHLALAAGSMAGFLVLLFALAGKQLTPVGVGTANAATVSATGTNLIANPSLEQSTSGWNQGSWGSNKATFTYNNTGHTGSHSATVSLASYKNGDAKWYPNAVNVSPATAYTFSDWYQSSVATEVDAVVTTTTGQTNYMWLANAPASSAWKQVNVSFNTPTNAKQITFYHILGKNGKLTIDDFDFEAAPPSTPITPVIPTPTPPNPNPNPVTPPAPTAPTVSITSPVTNAVVKGTQNLAVNVTDAQGIANVQYKLDGGNLGSPVTATPYGLAWDTTKVANGKHTLTAVATNTANLSTTSTSVTVDVENPTPPTVQITAPANNATVSGTQTVTVNATDKQGMANVQYKLDGTNLGSSVTTAPYSFSWDTTTATNGTHTLTAVATNIDNQSTTSTNVLVNVQNTVVTPPSGGSGTNTIPNPSVETPDSTAGQPQNWTANSWGTNTPTFSYLNTGHTGSHSLKISVTGYQNGALDWDYTSQPVTSGHYRYTDWYESDVSTEIDAAVTINGTVQYYYLGTVLPSATWAQASAEFDIPAGATSISIFHLIAANGSLTTDDFSFGPYTPSPFTRGLVSIEFDDGWTNQYTNALPLLNKYGLKGTFFIISGELTDQPDYMSTAQIKTLVTDGNEIGSHTVHHCDLTGQQTDDPVNCPLNITQTQITNEMTNSKTTLQNTFGVPITDFAYPYGAYNANTIALGNTLYTSQRTVNVGFNTKDDLNLSQLVVQDVYNTTTPAQVEAWVNQANTQHSWLILVYHEIAVTPSDPTDVQYDTQPSDLDAELNYIKQSGIGVDTSAQAIQEILPQL